MSTLDTMTPFISSPWLDAGGKSLAVRALPGLRPELLRPLERAYPGIMTAALKELLATCCGLADTDLGLIDFSGCCFPEEPCAVFKPCWTLAIDDAGRRWIAEVADEGLSGPVWCVFSDPEVALYVSPDIAAFIGTLHDHARRGQTLAWLQDLAAAARSVWSRRRALARRPYSASQADAAIRSWLAGLPADAYVYDLRAGRDVRGWPYGVAGPGGRLFRCGRLPVFAVAGSPTEGWRSEHPRTTSPIHPVAQDGAALAMTPGVSFRRLPQGRRLQWSPVRDKRDKVSRRCA